MSVINEQIAILQSNTQPPGNECEHGKRNKTNPPQNQGEIVACHEWPNLIINNFHHAEDNRSENRVADKMFQSLWHFTLNTKYDEKFLRREDEKLEAAQLRRIFAAVGEKCRDVEF